MILLDTTNSYGVSNYICLSCSNIRLVHVLDRDNEEALVCPNCGKTYYPKLHTMRTDPQTLLSDRLQSVATIQKGILSRDDRNYLSTQVASTTKTNTAAAVKNRLDVSPLIRRISKVTDQANLKHMPRKRNIRTTAYMKNEGSFFKEKHVPQEVINMGAEIVSFKETIE